MILREKNKQGVYLVQACVVNGGLGLVHGVLRRCLLPALPGRLAKLGQLRLSQLLRVVREEAELRSKFWPLRNASKFNYAYYRCITWSRVLHMQNNDFARMKGSSSCVVPHRSITSRQGL